MNSKELWLKKVENEQYLVGFKQETINEIEDLTYLMIIGKEFSAEEVFLEVESQKAVFEYSLPIAFEVVADYTEKILEAKKLNTNQVIAKIKPVSK